jgi:hypothetical protein
MFCIFSDVHRSPNDGVLKFSIVGCNTENTSALGEGLLLNAYGLSERDTAILRLKKFSINPRESKYLPIYNRRFQLHHQY